MSLFVWKMRHKQQRYPWHASSLLLGTICSITGRTQQDRKQEKIIKIAAKSLQIRGISSSIVAKIVAKRCQLIANRFNSRALWGNTVLDYRDCQSSSVEKCTVKLRLNVPFLYMIIFAINPDKMFHPNRVKSHLMFHPDQVKSHLLFHPDRVKSHQLRGGNSAGQGQTLFKHLIVGRKLEGGRIGKRTMQAAGPHQLQVAIL